jgi:hypothetical protein
LDVSPEKRWHSVIRYPTRDPNPSPNLRLPPAQERE